jgi:hypothetical protein
VADASSKALSGRIVGIETTDKLTDPQIVAKVKEHYGIFSPNGAATAMGRRAVPRSWTQQVDSGKGAAEHEDRHGR